MGVTMLSVPIATLCAAFGALVLGFAPGETLVAYSATGTLVLISYLVTHGFDADKVR